jgi:hypothetical protein
MFDVVLKHIAGERKTVPVEYISPNLTYITIRWDMAGLYDLNLAVNVLTPRNATVQAKGKAKWYKKGKPQWKAEDIAAVRKMASDHIKAKHGNPKAETESAIKRHVETMPNPRIGIEIDEVGPFERGNGMHDVIVPFPSYTGDPEVD